MRTVGNSKYSVMTNEDEFKDRVTSKFDVYFTPIILCILHLRELVFSGMSTSIELAKTLLRNNPGDKSVMLLLPMSHQDPDTICRLFVEILEQGVEALPEEHRVVPWMGPTSSRESDTVGVPVILVKKAAELQRAEGERPEDASAQVKPKPEGSRDVVGRSSAASGFVEPAPKASRGTKRTLNMSEPEAPSSGSSKKLRVADEQNPTSVGLRRSARLTTSASGTSRHPSDQSSSNSSMPKTPADQSPILRPRVRIGETNSEDLVNEISK